MGHSKWEKPVPPLAAFIQNWTWRKSNPNCVELQSGRQDQALSDKAWRSPFYNWHCSVWKLGGVGWVLHEASSVQRNETQKPNQWRCKCSLYLALLLSVNWHDMICGPLPCLGLLFWAQFLILILCYYRYEIVSLGINFPCPVLKGFHEVTDYLISFFFRFCLKLVK